MTVSASSRPRRAPRTQNPWLIAVIAGLASFVDGAALSANGWALVILQDTIGLSAAQFGVLTASVTVGLAIGALVGGRLGDLYGRRRIFLITMALIVIASLAPILSENFWIILAGLFLLGLGAGADLPVSLATVAEVATDKNRGAMLGFSHVMWILGSMIVALTTVIVGGWGQLGVQILYGIIFLVGLIGLLLRLTVPESTLWLEQKAEAARGTSTAPTRMHLAQLFRAPLVGPLLVLTLFYGFVSITGNVLSNYLAYVGTNVAGLTVAEISGPAVFLFPIGFIGLAVFMRLVDTRWRMPAYAVSGVLFPLAVLLPVFFGISLTTLLITFGVVTAAGIFSGGEPIARVWTNESFPTLLRSTGQGVVFTVGRLMVAVAAALAPMVIDRSPDLFFIGLAAAAAAGVLIGWWGHRRGLIVNEFTRAEDQEPAHV